MSERRRNGHWESAILPRAAELVESYDTPVTLRQLFYRLVSEETLKNTTSEYVQLGQRSATARRRQGFPLLIDTTREIVVPSSWTSSQDALRSLRDQYRRDRTEGQAWSIYIGVEKRGIVEQMRRWFGDPLGIPILPTGGYHSQPFEVEIERHIAAAGRPSLLLYAGDLDPEGEDIERHLLECTNFDKAIRVALTPELAEKYALPEQPGEPTSTRAPAFVDKYGHLFQIEVDALDPSVLRELFAAAIADYWDDEAYKAVLDYEVADREELA